MGYDATFKTILTFVICINIALTIIGASGVLPIDLRNESNADSPVTDPSNIANMLISLDTSSNNLILGGTALVVFTVLGWLAGNILVGGTVGIGLFAFTLFSPIVSWILFGLPRLMTLLGVPVYISAGILALISIPLFFTVLSMIAQRPVEGYG